MIINIIINVIIIMANIIIITIIITAIIIIISIIVIIIIYLFIYLAQGRRRTPLLRAHVSSQALLRLSEANKGTLTVIVIP